MAVNALSYVKNVGKSLGYAAIDTFKDYNPQVTALASSAKQLGNDLYQSIDDFKGSLFNKDESEKSLFDRGKSFITDYREALFDDLKSGKWYNKERMDEAQNVMLKEAFGFDESMFDLDAFDDFDFDDDEDVNVEAQAEVNSAQAIIASDQQNTKAIIANMDAVGSKSSSAISNATVRSADYIVQSNKEANRALYRLNERGFGSITNGLAAVNANISSLVALGDPLTKHMQNSSTFYTHSTEFQNQVLEQLDKLVKNTTPVQQAEAKRAKNTLNDFMTAEGIPDLSAYFGYIKESVKSVKDEMQGMVDMFGGWDSVSATGKASPLKPIVNGIMKGLIPQLMKDSMKSFNDTLGSFFGAAIDKAQRSRPDGPLGEILDIFGSAIFPKSGFKSTVSTGQLTRGKVDWDTDSAMALKQVIPTYLSAIASALTGQPMTRYDYKTGKYLPMKTVKAQFRYLSKERARRAGGDFRYDVMNWIQGDSGLSKQQQDQYKKEIDAFFQKEFDTGAGNFTKIKNKGFSDETLSSESLAILRDFLDAYAKQGKTNKALEVSSSIRMERDRYGDELREIETDPDSVFRYLFNDSKKITGSNKKAGAGIFGVDDQGYGALFYLRGIYNNTVGKGGKIIGNDSAAKDAKNSQAGRATEEEAKQNANKVSDSENDQGRTTGSTRRNIDDYVFSEYANDSKAKRAERDARRAAREKEEGLRESGLWTPEAQAEINKELDEAINKGSTVNKVIDVVKKFAHGDEGVVGNIKGIYEKVSGIFNTPATVVSEILAAGQTSMFKLIYGEDATDQDGLFAYFMKKADALFEKFEKNSDKKYYESFKAWMKDFISNHGGKQLWDETKQGLKSAGEWVVDQGKMVWNGRGGPNSYITEEGDIISEAEWAAYGSGLKNAKGKRYSGGASRLSDFVQPGKFTNKVKTQSRRSSPRYEQASVEGTDDDVLNNINFTVDNSDKNTARQEKIRRAQDPGKYGIKGVITGSMAKLGEGVEAALRQILPNSDDVDKIKGAVDNESSKALKENLGGEIKHNKGAMGAGALIGAGASILSGALVGPVAGAAIGSAVGLLTRSRSLQNALFGPEDEEGNRRGGMIPKNMSNFLTKNLPSMGIGGVIGGTIATLFGGPFGLVGSTALGAGIGYLQSSEKAKSYLFGEIGEDGTRKGGLVSKNAQNFIKKSLPNVGAGMLAGAIAGPFGIVGNLAVGGALGFASTTDTFKDFVLGKEGDDGKRHGGITGWIKNYFFGKEGEEGAKRNGIFTSLRGIMDKLLNEMNWHVKNLFSWIQKEISEKLIKSTAKKITDFVKERTKNTVVGRAARKVGRGVKRVAGAVNPLNLPRFALDQVNKSLDRRALKRGYNVRNYDENRMMTAQERMDERSRVYLTDRQRIGDKNFQSADEWMANASTGDLQNMLGILENYSDPRKLTNEVQKLSQNNILDMMKGMDKDNAALLERLAAGNLSEDETNKFLNSLDENTRNKINDNVTALNTAKNAGDNAEATMNLVRTQLARDRKSGGLGFDIGDNGAGGADRLADLIRNELKVNHSEEAQEKKQKDQDRADTKDMQSNIEKMTDYTKQMVDLLDKTLNKLVGKEEGEGLTDEQNSEVTEGILKGESPVEKLNEVRKKASSTFNLDDEESTSDDSGEGSGLVKYKKYSGGGVVGVLTGLLNPTVMISKSIGKFAGKFIASKMVSPILEPVVNPLNFIAGSISSIKDSIGSRSLNKKFDNGEVEEGTKHTHVTMTGDIMQTITGKDGEEHVDLSDSETKQAIEGNNVVKRGFTAMASMSETMSSLPEKLFGRKKKDDSDEEENGGIFSSIWKVIKSFFGSGSMIGKLAIALVGGSLIKKFISGLVEDLGLDGLIDGVKNAIGTVSSAINNIGGMLGELDIFKGNNTDSVFEDDSGNKMFKTDDGEVYSLATDEDGNIITDDEGNYQTTTGDYIDSESGSVKYVGEDRSITSQLKKAAVTQATSANGSIAKAASKTLGTIAKSTDVATVSEWIAEAAVKLSSGISNCFFLPKAIRSQADDIANNFMASISDYITSSSSLVNKFASAAKSVLQVVQIASLVITITNAWGNAASILGIVDTPTMGQRAIAILVAAVNSLIPFIGNLIPNDVIVNIAITILTALGFDLSSLEEQREEANEIVSQFNEDNDTEVTIAEYNEANGKVGWFTSLKHTLFGKTSNAGNTTTSEDASETDYSTYNGYSTDSEQNLSQDQYDVLNGQDDYANYTGYGSGLLRQLSGGSSGAASSYLSSNTLLSGSGDTVAGTFNNTGNLVQNKLQLLTTDFSKMSLLASAGNTSGLWNYSTGSVEEASSITDNPISGYMDAVDVIGKLYYTPNGILALTGNSMLSTFSDQSKNVSGNISSLNTDLNNIIKYMEDGDMSDLWSYSLKVAESATTTSPVDNYMKAAGLMNKMIYSVPTLFNNSGKLLHSSLTSYTNPFQSDYELLEEKIGMMDDYALEGKVSDIWNNITYTPDSDNIMSSFFSSAFEFNKIFYVAASITNKLFGFFGKVIDDLRDTTGGISDGATWLFSKWQDWFGGTSSTTTTTTSSSSSSSSTTSDDSSTTDDSTSTDDSSSEVVVVLDDSTTGSTSSTTASKSTSNTSSSSSTKVSTVSKALAAGSGLVRPTRRYSGGSSKIVQYRRPGYAKLRRYSGGATTKICFVGDSRTVGMQSIYGSDGNTWICEVGKGYSWFNSTAASKATSAAGSGVAIVILLGVNDMYQTSYASKYVTLINSYASTWQSKGSTVYYVSVNPVASGGYKTSYGSITNTNIEKWNSTMKSGLDSSIKYIDTYSTLMSDGYTTTDGIHYNSDTYKKIYELVVSAVTNGTGTSSSSSSSGTTTTTTTSSSTGNWLTQLANGVTNIFTEALGGSGSGTGEKTYRPHASMQKRVRNAMRLQSAAGSGLQPSSYSGGSSDYFVSQLDSKYSNKSLGFSNVASKGCGPAAATMMSNYLKPGSMSMNDAVNSSRSYQDANGTEANYFGDVLGKKGISTSYIDSSTNRGKTDLVNSIASGKPTTLLGRDPYNTSKDNSPFGPNNHYVMATGFDKKGNVIVDDPENSGTRTYDSSILNNVSLGVSADGTGMYSGMNLGDYSGASTYPDNTTTQSVWGYLTSNGYSTATSAGIMGNLWAESGIDPTSIQSNGAGPAAGIAQWENYNTKSARWKNLNTFAAANGKDWTDLDSQMRFLNAETTGDSSYGATPDGCTDTYIKKYAGSIDAFKNLTDPREAADIFEKSFERAGVPALEKRENAAEAYYNLYSGSTYTGNYSGSTDSTSSSDTTTTSSTGNYLTQLINGITNIFTEALGGTVGETTTTSSSSTNLTGSEAQKAVLKYVTDMEGTLTYSQQQRNPANGSADCSSMVYYAYKNVLGKDIGTWTNPQSTTDALETVQIDSHATYNGGVNRQSDGPDTSILEPGDLLFYDRSSSGNPYLIGHVEMYDGAGHRWGMRSKSEQGPIPRDITNDAERFVMARRLKDINSATVSGSGSGLLRKVTPRTVAQPVQRQQPVRMMSGGASGSTTVTTSSGNTETLLNKLIGLVETLVENTNNLNDINENVASITNYYNEKVASNVSSASNGSGTSSGSDIDSSMKDLINTMNTVATG